MNIKINILNQNTKIPQDIIDAADGNELIARIFLNRGYKDPETVRQMLHDGFYVPTQPYDFPNMGEAVERIAKAIDKSEPIAIYGDYDVDGVTSTVTLVQCLKMFTENVVYHVPDRFSEGYGMNEGVIRELAKKGVSLVITCDCGISNSQEIALAKEMGMDVIVTDHHNLPDELPAADIILNPKLLEEGHKARNISGCGMAYFLAAALLERYERKDMAQTFLDLLALSLVADVVGLNGENRYLLKKAMPELFNTKRTGLKELFLIIEQNGKMQSEEDIAFQIAPRINAAGRMESARLPVELLLSDNIFQTIEIAQKIDLLNKERKSLQQQIIDQAIEMVENKKRNKAILVLYGEFWHHGIIGIAAGKICEMYGRPAILLSLKEDGETIVGSARSTDDIDIYELLKACDGKLLKYGGHSQAAGLSVKKEDLEAFTQEVERAADKVYSIKNNIVVDVDFELDLEKVDEELHDCITGAGPYGEGFETPVFLSRKVTVLSDRKTEKKHHIMVLADKNDTRLSAVKWFGGDAGYQGKTCDVIYKIGRNNYRGNNELRLTLEHIIEVDDSPSGAFNGKFIDEREACTEEVLKKYKGAAVFYEGLSLLLNIDNVIDRYSPQKAETLVLISTPVNTPVFREVVSIVNPSAVVLNFSVLPDYSLKGFVTNFMGIIKHSLKDGEGEHSLEDMSVKLVVEENIIVAAFKYLKAAGKIEYTIDGNKVHFYACNDSPQQSISAFERNLKAALVEKTAYSQFILNLEAQSFMKYLK